MRHRVWSIVALALLCLGLAATVADAQSSVWVNPYTRTDGSYVPGHYRTAPDSNPYNNWSTYPNVNPYTGQQGHRHVDDPYSGLTTNQRRCVPTPPVKLCPYADKHPAPAPKELPR